MGIPRVFNQQNLWDLSRKTADLLKKNGISPMTENTSPTNWMGSGISLIGFFYGKPPANQLKMTWTFVDYQR